MEVLLAIVIVVLVAAWVAVPLRGGREAAEAGVEDPVLAELEARKQAKYREIRDSELDHAQGKLGDEEFARQDAELRAEAIEILRRIDAAGVGDEGRRGRTAPVERLDCPPVETLLSIVQVFVSIILILLVLLHSGKDAGLSGAFGIGGGGSSFGGGSLVERNLDRWTIFFALLFVINTIVLLKI